MVGLSTNKSSKCSASESAQRALSPRSLILGALGSAIITASSLYVALRLGALPWPIVFAALMSLFVLKLLGHTSMNEVNVAHTAMSAGAMVAGGMAFSIPAIWIAGLTDEVSLPTLLVVSFAGVIVGLTATLFVRKYFMEDHTLTFPVGVSAAETLRAADENLGSKTHALFSAMGITALFTILRDGVKCIPTIITGGITLPGSVFGLYASPMMAAMGYIIGPLASAVWFIGALIGDGVLVQLTSTLHIVPVEVGQAMKSSLGLGLMFGCGVGVILKQLFSLGKRRLTRSSSDKTSNIASPERRSAVSPHRRFVESTLDAAPTSQRDEGATDGLNTRNLGGLVPTSLRIIATLICALVALVLSIVFELPIALSVCLIIGAGICVVMAGQCAGATGVDPMEVFGVLMLLIIRVIFPDTGLLSLFLLSAVVAVACGLAGDTLNDFKVGQMFGTDPRDQWIAQCIGALIGAGVSAVVLFALIEAYGPASFGLGQMFVAAQAQVVATMAAGVPDMTTFVIGLGIGLLATLVGLPIMTLGLGVYLPLYLTLTVALGGLIRFIVERIGHIRPETGIAAASGVLGGESLIGVALAFLVMFSLV